jgi:poly-gamma-glutamate synthesis protein (capsule biosynthesis protein)
MNKWLVVTAIFISLLCAVVFLYPKQNQKVVVSEPINIAKRNNKDTKPTPTPQTTNKLTLNSIFIKQISSDLSSIVIAATGDYIPARSVNYISVSNNDFLWTVKETAPLFKTADVVLVSLESPLIKDCPLTNEGFVFCGSQNHIQALKAINTSVVNLANNHSHNYGEVGINQTTDLLNKNNIKYSGIYGEDNIVEVKGAKIGFLGYNNIGANPYPIKPAEKDLIAKDISDIKQKVDFVVVSFSWGTEYTTNITQNQKDLAHFAIDSGADLIIGNHPHIVQPIEIYKNKLITYAHGNYVFDQEWADYTKTGILGFYEINNNQVVEGDFEPIYIKDYGRSTIPTENFKKEVLDSLLTTTKKLEKTF